MEVNEMKKEIIEFLDKYGNASFVELERIDGFLDESKNKEDSSEYFGNVEFNIYWWVNVSDAAIKALNELKREETIKLSPCNFLIYAHDGKILNLPIAKRIRKYKKPRWIPVEIKLLRKS